MGVITIFSCAIQNKTARVLSRDLRDRSKSSEGLGFGFFDEDINVMTLSDQCVFLLEKDYFSNPVGEVGGRP